MRKQQFYGVAGFAAVALVSGSALSADLSVQSAPDFAYAHEGTGPVVELGGWGGWYWRDGSALNETVGGDFEDDSMPIIGGNAAFATPLGSMFVTQFDLDAEWAFADAEGDTYLGSVVGGAHLAYGSIEGGSIGAFGAVGATADESDDQNATLWAAGVEGRAVFGMLSLLGQVGYLDSDADDQEQFGDAWFVRAVARSALNGGRTILEGELSYADGAQDHDSSPADDVTIVGWGVEVEQEFASSGSHRLTGFLRYDGLYTEEDGSGGSVEAVDHIVKGGVRIVWGGATPGGVPFSLPRLGHWVGAATVVD